MCNNFYFVQLFKKSFSSTGTDSRHSIQIKTVLSFKTILNSCDLSNCYLGELKIHPCTKAFCK